MSRMNLSFPQDDQGWSRGSLTLSLRVSCGILEGLQKISLEKSLGVSDLRGARESPHGVLPWCFDGWASEYFLLYISRAGHNQDTIRYKLLISLGIDWFGYPVMYLRRAMDSLKMYKFLFEQCLISNT